MSFQILDHLDKLEKYGKVTEKPTWVLATCPVCSGKLKINKNPLKYGAYACYTDNCHEKVGNPIRKLLYTKLPFAESTAFKITPTRSIKLVELVDPVPIKANPVSFLTTIPFTPPSQIRERNRVFTYFDYDGFRVVRLDARLADGTRRKYIYPEYQDFTGEFVRGLPTQLDSIPIYTISYLQPAMVFAEGEKTATIGQKLGIATVTFPTFAFSERYIDIYARELSSKGLTDVLYLEDNDSAGKKKASLVSTYFWKHGIGTKSVNLVDLFPDKKCCSGFDLYDAYKADLVTPGNVESIIEELISA